MFEEYLQHLQTLFNEIYKPVVIKLTYKCGFRKSRIVFESENLVSIWKENYIVEIFHPDLNQVYGTFANGKETLERRIKSIVIPEIKSDLVTKRTDDMCAEKVCGSCGKKVHGLHLNSMQVCSRCMELGN